MTEQATYQSGLRPALVCLAAMVLLSGCGESKDSGAGRTVSKSAKPSMVAAAAGPTTEHLGLTPAYLEGDWCSTHIQFPNTRSTENRNHRFSADGSFAAQTDPKSEMKPGLVYRYRPDGKIGMDSLLYQVKSVQPDDFVLRIAVNDLHFHRGACK